jgi:hypothetical protein
MRKNISLLVALAVAIILCASGNASAQTVTQLKAEGFVPAAGTLKNSYLYVPSETVPFMDVYLGNVEVTVPPRKRGDGPMIAPVKVLLDGKLEVNPASAGVFVSPTTKKGWMRVHWAPTHLTKVMKDNPNITGPGFGLVGGEEFVLEDGSFASQFYVPKSVNGGFVTGTNWGFLVFTTEVERTTYLKSDDYVQLKKKREKAKDEEKPKDDKKADPKDDKKADPKVDPKDAPKEGKKD